MAASVHRPHSLLTIDHPPRQLQCNSLSTRQQAYAEWRHSAPAPMKRRRNRSPPRSSRRKRRAYRASGFRISSTIWRRSRRAGSTAMPIRSSPGRRSPSISAMPAAASPIPASTARSMTSPRPQSCSALPSSHGRTPIPAVPSAISPVGWPDRAWSRSPPPMGQLCSPAPARSSRSTAPTRCPLRRRPPTARRSSSTNRRVPPPMSTSARRPRTARGSRKVGRWTPAAIRPPIRRRR